jgi:outer membrane immunogenic protein
LADNPNAGANNYIGSQMNWFATLRGRAGVAVGNSLFYVTGGVVWADIDTTITLNNADFLADHVPWGVVGGAGAEFLLGGNWSLGGEVLYMQFAESSDTLNTTPLYSFNLSDSALIARVSLNYRFGGGGGYEAVSTNGTYGGSGPFSGFYAGANVGALGWSAFRDDNDGFLTDNSGWTNSDIHATGGFQIGYDWQSGPAVVGLVADWNWASANAFLRDEPNDPTDDNFIDSQMNWFATARGRAGVAVGNTLVYVTGGVVWADFDTTITDNAVSFSDGGTRWGLVGGAGAEFAFGGGWSLGTEVLYMRFAEDSQTFNDGGTLYQFDYNDSALVARLALNYRFGAAGYSSAEYDTGPQRFTGWYAGLTTGGVGYIAARNDNDGFLVDNSGWTATDIHLMAGAEIGYDWQNGSNVLGVVADWTWVSAYADTPNNPNGGSSGGITSKMDWFATLRGRAGLAVDRTLVYVTGGVALTQIDTSISDPATSPLTFTNDETRWGLVGGAGVEHAFGNGWSLGGEVLYMQFAEDSQTFNNGSGTLYQFDYNDSAIVGKVKLSYRFGGAV